MGYEMIKNYRIWIISILLIAAPRLLIAEAIVNIEDMRREGEIGFFTSVSLALSASRGNKVRDSLSAQIRFDNNTDRYDSFLVMKKDERKTNNVKWDDASMAHARFVLKNDSIYDTEMFIQQSKNPFRRYLQRDVIGAGTRISINDHGRLGLGVLSENETPNPITAYGKSKLASFEITKYYRDKKNIKAFNAIILLSFPSSVAPGVHSG